MKYLILTLSLFITIKIHSQVAIEVTEQTLKIGGGKEEEIYLGFAEGDKVIFNFREVNDKEVKEIEIIEYPDNSKFSDFKTAKVDNKTFTVQKQSAYKFRIKNGAINGRICKISIQRIPASDATKNFNTSVSWETKQETSYRSYTKNVLVGYDTTYIQKTRKELVSSEQKEVMILDKMQRVHSTTSNGNKCYLTFSLPSNQKNEYSSSEVIAWAYWVGVGEESNKAWRSNASTISGLAKGTATYFTTPLGALAVGAVVDLALPKLGEDVTYALTDLNNSYLFMAGNPYRTYDAGKGIASYKRFTESNQCQGTYCVCMHNDNLLMAIDANVKVVAIIETKLYTDRQYTEPLILPRYEQRTFSDPQIKTFKVPIVGG